MTNVGQSFIEKIIKSVMKICKNLKAGAVQKCVRHLTYFGKNMKELHVINNIDANLDVIITASFFVDDTSA